MNEKPILAFDCATQCASIALSAHGTLHESRLPPNRHAAMLMSEIDRLMHEAGLSYSQLGAIITTVGPGSFTGIRIGLAALQGMALASHVPVKTLTTLEAMAWEVATRTSPPTDFYTSLRAGKGEAYAQAFTLKDGMPECAGEIALVPEAAGLGADHYGNLQPLGHANYIESPDAVILCGVTLHIPACLLHDAVPIYIRPPDAALPAALPWLA